MLTLAYVSIDAYVSSPTTRPAAAADRVILTSRVRGYFPFPIGEADRGPLYWLFRDVHQAVHVRSSEGERVTADFMTAGGAAHPVWWDENLKWRVLLGATIAGEVRVRGAPCAGSKLARLAAYAREYDTGMHLYANNCRVFAARMRREAARLNAEDAGPDAALDEAFADARLLAALAHAALLPALYPLCALLLCGPAIADIVRF